MTENLVKPGDLTPLLVCSTDAEMREAVEWLNAHSGDGLPVALARIAVSADYRLAWDAHRDKKLAARYTADVAMTVKWVPDSRAEPTWRETVSGWIRRYPKEPVDEQA